jgi:DNA polymerase III delta prime subunit
MAKYALVIGIQEYGGLGFSHLEMSATDAEDIAQILSKDFEITRLPSGWNEEKKSEEIRNERLTGREIDQSITNFFSKAKDNEALIYFSGHGYQVTRMGLKKGYLAMSDSTTDNIETTGISLEDLNKLILNTNFYSLVILLDCCHSGSFLEINQINSAFNAFSGTRNYCLVASCRENENAYENVFTSALLTALKSPSEDGRVGTAKLHEVITSELRNSGQTPVFMQSGEEIILVTRYTTEKIEPDKLNKLQAALDELYPDYEILDKLFFKQVASHVSENNGRDQIRLFQAVNWKMLFQQSYVERDQQREALEKALCLSQNEVSLMLISGEPGAGKTALLRWLARELSYQGKRIFRQKNCQYGWLEQLKKFSKVLGGEHFYVITDDLFRGEMILGELKQNEFPFPLTLIGTTRQNEDKHYELQGKDYEIACLNLAKPSMAEKERILALPWVQTHLEEKSNVERQKLMDSPTMLVLMLQLSEGKTFDMILWGIIKNLSNTDLNPLYRAFGVLCSFSQYGIIVPFEILQLCLPPSDLSAKSILSRFKGLVDIEIKSGYQGLIIIHELIAKTVINLDYYDENCNQSYSYINPSLLEQSLILIIQKIDLTQETQKRWLLYSFRLLVGNEEIDLVSRILQKYSQQIETTQENNTVSSWLHWAKVYEAINFQEKQKYCINSILSSQPNISHDWVLWLSCIQKLGNSDEQQAAIIQTEGWLKEYPGDSYVRRQYLVLVENIGDLEIRKKVIKETQIWLDNHRSNGEVRRHFLGLIEKHGDREQQKSAMEQTKVWLDNHLDDQDVRIRYLGLVKRQGNGKQQESAMGACHIFRENNPLR